MTSRRDSARRFAETAAWIVLTVPLGLALVSAMIAPETNWSVRTAALLFCVLAVARPDSAVLVTAAFAGFGIILSHLAGVPTLRATEALVVASLAGYAVRAAWTGAELRRPLVDSIVVPVVLLAVAAVVSAVVWERVYQSEAVPGSKYLLSLFHFITYRYFVDPGDFLVLVSTFVLLEGLALFVIAATLVLADDTFFDRATRMLVIGGAGLAILSIVRLVEILIRNPSAIETLRATSVGLRISPQIPDYIAAGSYFALCWLTGLGIAYAASRRRLLWLGCGLPIVAALYLTGSRSVIAAAGAGLILPAVIGARQKGASVRALAAAAVLTVAVMAVTYPWMTGRDIAGTMAWKTLTVRAELIKTGGRVLATRPLFGVGMDRFYQLAPLYASPVLRELWTGRMNPHNDFLRITTELGAIGGVAFIWIVVAAGRQIWNGLVRTSNGALAGLAGGLVAFLVTCVFSNPLMVRDVSYVFWIALGLAVGQAMRLVHGQDGSLASDRSRIPARWRWSLALAIAGVLVASIPSRMRQELAVVNPARVSFGLYEWNVDADGTRWRWSGPQATLFVDARARIVEIPLSGRGSSSDQGNQDVEVRINGRLANRVSVGPDWQRLRMLLPPTSAIEPHRIDLSVSRTWLPADVVPGNQDRRAHGVRVGEPRITKASN